MEGASPAGIWGKRAGKCNGLSQDSAGGCGEWCRIWGIVSKSRAGHRKGASSGTPVLGPGHMLELLVELKMLTSGPSPAPLSDSDVQQRLRTTGLGPCGLLRGCGFYSECDNKSLEARQGGNTI